MSIYLEIIKDLPFRRWNKLKLGNCRMGKWVDIY